MGSTANVCLCPNVSTSKEVSRLHAHVKRKMHAGGKAKDERKRTKQVRYNTHTHSYFQHARSRELPVIASILSQHFFQRHVRPGVVNHYLATDALTCGFLSFLTGEKLKPVQRGGPRSKRISRTTQSRTTRNRQFLECNYLVKPIARNVLPSPDRPFQPVESRHAGTHSGPGVVSQWVT